MKKIINKVLGRANKFERNTLNEIVVLVHKDARHHTAHGFVSVTHHAQRIKNAPVAFVFPDLPEAPALSLRLMTDLWEALHAQGYIPHEIVSYGTMTPMMPEEHSSDDAFALSAPGFTAHEFAHLQTNVSQTNDFLSRVAKPHPERHGMHVVPAASHGDVLDPIVAGFASRVSKFDEETRETAKIRFDQIVRNGVSRNESPEQIKDRLESALQQIREDHDARQQRQRAAAARVAGAEGIRV